MAMMTIGLNRCLRLQLEEETVVPWEHKVEPRTTEEGTNNRQDSPEHQVNREQGNRELSIFRLVRRVLVDIRRQDK